MDDLKFQDTRAIRGESVMKRELACRMRRKMTPAERRLWQHVRANRLDGLHFRRQVVIAGFIVDFYCVSLGLVVEVDGDIHDYTKEYDAERTAVLAQRGIRMIRFSNDDVMGDTLTVVRAIRVACQFGA